MVEVLSRLAAAHFRDQQPSLRLTAMQRFLIAVLYRNFLRTLVGILRRSDSEASIRQAVDELSRYHLAGLKAFFEGGMEAWHGKPS